MKNNYTTNQIASNNNSSSRCFEIGSLFKYIGTFLLLFLIQNQVYAAIITSTATGNWNATTTWVGGVVPTASDDVVIAAGHTVTVTANTGSVISLTINGVLNIGGFTTTITGATIINSGGTLSLVTSTAGTKTFTGDFTVESGGQFTNPIGEGVTFSGNFTNNGSFSSAGGTSTISGNFTNTGTFSPAAGPYTISGDFTNNGSFSSGTGAYTFGTTAGSRSINSATDIVFGGAVTINTATYTNNVNSLTITGNLLGTGTLVNAANKTLILSGGTNSVSNLTASANPNTVNYNRNATQSVKGTTYHHLSISTDNTKTAGADISVNGLLTVASGTTLAMSTFLLNSLGSLSQTGTISTTNTSANPIPTGITWTGPIIYSATANQTIVNGNYANNLTLSGSGTKTLAASNTVDGNLFITGVTLNDNGNILTVKGDITNTGVHTGAGKIVLSGGASQHTLFGSGTYNNLELNDALGATLTSLGITVTVSGLLTLTNGDLSLGTSGGALELNGTISCISGRISGSTGNIASNGLLIGGTGNLGTIVFSPGAKLNKFTMNRTGTATFGSDVTIGITTALGNATALTLTNGTVNCGSNSILFWITSDNLDTYTPNASFDNYFSFQPGGSLRWNRTTAGSAALVGKNLKFPIGFNGAVNGYRGIDIVPQGSNSIIDATFSFANHDGFGVSSTDVPTTGNNRAGYILNISIASGGFGTGIPDVTMRYANGDFNAGAPTIGNVHPYTFTVGSWTQQIQSGNASGTINEISKSGFAFNSGTTAIVLGVEGGTDLGGAPTTFTWSGLGATGANNWFDSGNWVEGAVPNAPNAEVTINYAGTNNPDLNGTVDVNFIDLLQGSLNLGTGAALTLAGDFTITNGSLTAQVTAEINGVAGNTFSLGAGATFTTLRTTAPWFPTNMSVSINNASTVQYGTANTSFTLNNSVPQTYGNLIIGSNITLAASHPFTINGNLTINTSRTLNDNGNTITVKGNITNINTTNSTHASTGAGKILLDGGSAHTISGGQFGNLEINDASGVTTLGNTTINNILTLNTGVFTITGGTVTINDNINTINGTIAGGTTNSRLSIAGTSGGSAGTINFSGSSPELSHFVMNRAGANASVTIGTNLSVLTTVTFTNGTVNIGNNTFTYLGTAGDLTGYNPNAGLNNYVAIEPGGWFQWNPSGTIGSAELKFPVGPAGTVSGFRGVYITPSSTATVNVRIGFINHSGGGVSATNVPTTGNNRTNFITNIDMISGNFGGTPAITFRYADGDFNAGAPTIADVDPYSYLGGSWTLQTKNSSTTGAINTITKDVFALTSGINPIVLGVAGGASFAGAPTDFEWVGLGANNTNNWFDPTNWNPTGIPNANDANITIDYSGPNMPQLNAAVDVNNVDFINGTFTMNASADMNINGDFTITNGTMTVNATTNFSGLGGNTFSLGAGGTYIVSRTAAPWFPTNMTVTINNASTVQYGTAAVANNLNTSVPQNYGNLIINSNVTLPSSHPFTIYGNLSINTSRTLNDNGNIITVKGNITNATTTSSIHLSVGSGKILLDGGAGHTISGGVYGNLELNDAAGASILGTTRVVNTLILNNGALSNTGTTVLTVEGAFNSINGTLTGGGYLTVLGTTGGSAGTVNFSGSAPQLGRIVLNRTGANASLTFGTDVTLNAATGIQLQNGTLNIGTNNLTYNQSNAIFTSYTPNANFDNYIAIGNGGSFRWNATGVTGTGLLRIPIGPAGIVSGYRAIHITPNTSQLVDARFSFANHSGGSSVSATNVPTSGNNRTNYIANIEILSGSFGSSPTLEMRYLNSDFNGAAPALADVDFYRHAGFWQKIDQTSNTNIAPFNVISRTGFPLSSGNNSIVLGEDGGSSLNVLLNDASITNIIFPSPIVSATPLPVNLEVSNFGTNSITSVSVIFTINGVPTTVGPFSVNIAAGASQTVNIGNFSFPASGFSPYVVSAESTLPNNTTDGNPANDLYAENNFYTCFSGNITVGSGGNFTTITTAFNALSVAGICGAVNVSLISNSYPGETFPLSLNTVAGTSATNTITIKPAVGANPTISGASAGALIEIVGTNYVTFDGSNNATAPINTVCPPVTATSSISFTNSSTAANTRGILISNASNVTIKNSSISCSSTSSIGILANGTGDNNQFINNTITNANIGISSIGVSAANKKNGTIIQQNNLTNIRTGGILAGFENNISISGNTISSNASVNGGVFGISLGFSANSGLPNTSTPTASSEVSNALVERNIMRLHRPSNACFSLNNGLGSAIGIGISNTSIGTHSVHHNLIDFNIPFVASSDGLGAGILIGGGGSVNYNIYFNTVRFSFQAAGPASCFPQQNTFGFAAFATTNSSGSINIRNNNFVNLQRATGGVSHNAIGFGFTNLNRVFSNNNNFYVTETGTGHHIAQIGSLLLGGGTLYKTMSDYQSATNKDPHSISVLPTFVNPGIPSDLRLATTSSNGPFNFAGTPITGITQDIDCNTLNPIVPTIGANTISVIDKIWVGGTAGNLNNWYEPNNWSPTGVPTTSHVTYVGITANDPVVSSGPGANSAHLGVAFGASVIIESDGALTVASTLYNIGTMNVESGGALVQSLNSTLQGLGTYNVKRIIPGSGSVFRFMGSPINNINVNTVSGITATGTNGAQLVPMSDCNANSVAVGSPYGNILELRDIPAAEVLFDCSQSLWFVKRSGLLENARAYSMKASGGETVTFSGAQANNGAVSYSGLTRQSGTIKDHITGPIGGVTRGWHLVSNPYPSPIAIPVNYLLGLGFDNQIHLWDSEISDWTSTMATTGNPVIIAVGQGFQIRKATEGGTASFSLNNDLRVPNVGATFFSADEFGDYRLRIDLSGNNFTDKTTVFFHPDATPGFDPVFDINKMIGSPSSPALFTMAGIERMAYNGLPLLSQPITIPMVFYPGTSGTYTLDFSQLETLPSTAMVYLEDKKTGVWTNMRVDNTYTFTSLTSDNIQRFNIHFEPPMSFKVENESCEKNDGVITINNPSNETWDVSISKNGEEVFQENIASGETVINNLAPGTYTLNLNANSYAANEEIFIEASTPIYANITSVNSNYSTYEVIFAEVVNPIENAIYTWYLNDLMAGVGTSVSFAISDAGDYTLRLDASSGECKSSATESFKVEDNATSLKNIEDELSIRAFPNPANEMITILWNKKVENFETVLISDLSGRTIERIQLSGRTQGNQIQLDLRNIAEGMYLITLEGKDVRRTVKVSVVK